MEINYKLAKEIFVKYPFYNMECERARTKCAEIVKTHRDDVKNLGEIFLSYVFIKSVRRD